MSALAAKILDVSSQGDPEALRKDSRGLRKILEDRLVAIAEGQAYAAKSLHVGS